MHANTPRSTLMQTISTHLSTTRSPRLGVGGRTRISSLYDPWLPTISEGLGGPSALRPAFK